MEKIMSNIESFNRCTALIFAELYRSFPFRKEISLSSLPEGIFDDISEEDRDGTFERLMVLEETGKWLVEAGYIWAGQVTESTIHGAILSPKGLEVLKSMPSSISMEQTLGERMGELVQKGSYSLLSKVADKALSIGVAIATGTTI
jgi:hypothetical protein